MNAEMPATKETLRSLGPGAYIKALIATFPCLRIKVGSYIESDEPFDADAFWNLFVGASHGERLCALFVLNVWNPGYANSQEWDFDLIEFVGSADSGNRKALLNWIANPVWP